jgi:hypothetical protein
MFSYEYPFWLAKGHYPYTKIGKRNAAIYWGNEFTYGEDGELPFGDSEELIFDFGITQENPETYTKATDVFTELVFGWRPFRFIDFALDLSREKIEVSEMLPRVGEKVPYQRQEEGYMWGSLPRVIGEVNGSKLLFQVDIGDRYSSVPKQIVEGLEPIRTEMLEPYGSFRRRKITEIYSVPIRLSPTVEIVTEAVATDGLYEAGFMFTGTNGCIGVDLIRNHRVTFTPDLNEDSEPAMYFKPFAK